MEETISHPLYPRVKLEEADAVAWITTSKDGELVQYPFKFLPLEPTEVRLKILHTSICHSDIMHMRQQWGPVKFPCCTGHEIVGEITHLGGSVTNLIVGEKVGVSPVRYTDMTCRYCQKGHDQLCQKRIHLYGDHFGGFCTHLQIDSNWAIKIPEGLDLKDLPPILCAGISVYAPLKRFHKQGGSCAVLGIGGLGHMAIQYANKLGMKVTAFTTKPNNFEILKQLGAHDAQSSINLEELKKNEGKYDVVISTLYIDNPELYRAHQRLTRHGGAYVILGVPHFAAIYEVDNEYLINNEITVAGSNLGSSKEFKEMLEFTAKTGVKSQNEYFSFEDFPKALYRSEKEAPQYRTVINVTDWAKKNGFDK